MIVKAKQSFVNYVEKSADYLSCPTFIFNHHLNGTYRQFYDKPRDVVINHLARLLYTFDYNKTESMLNASKLYDFYTSTSNQTFLRLNTNRYLDKLPEHLVKLDNHINATIESRKTWYWNGVPKSQGYYQFKKGYRLKNLP